VYHLAEDITHEHEIFIFGISFSGGLLKGLAKYSMGCLILLYPLFLCPIILTHFIFGKAFPNESYTE
jgi:hypothetical protein